MKKIALLLAALLLSACSQKPSDELISQQVTQQLQQQHGEHIFEVINLKKVNGISSDDGRYKAEVEYDLRFLIDLKDVASSSDNILTGSIETASLLANYGNFVKGDTIHRKEWVHFVHSEQGWMIDTAKR